VASGTLIVVWHRSHVSKGPAEVNDFVNRVERVAFGMRDVGHYRIRALRGRATLPLGRIGHRLGG
jgi:hypothetical protein